MRNIIELYRSKRLITAFSHNMARQSKTKLTNGLLGMKFMQRTKRKFEVLDDIEESQAIYSSEVTKQMRHGESHIITQSSIIFCEQFTDGRLSFGGMNPEIEYLMTQDKPDEDTHEKEVSDKEMAERYGSLVNTMNKRFKKEK